MSYFLFTLKAALAALSSWRDSAVFFLVSSKLSFSFCKRETLFSKSRECFYKYVRRKDMNIRVESRCVQKIFTLCFSKGTNFDFKSLITSSRFSATRPLTALNSRKTSNCVLHFCVRICALRIASLYLKFIFKIRFSARVAKPFRELCFLLLKTWLPFGSKLPLLYKLWVCFG